LKGGEARDERGREKKDNSKNCYNKNISIFVSYDYDVSLFLLSGFD
jgi:hypothetical protein